MRCLSSVLISLLLLAGCGDPADTVPAMSVEGVLGGDVEDGFARAEQPRDFVFPGDHRNHPEFRNEWWYVTGNLEAENGDDFGYQITLFRTGMQADVPSSTSRWAANAVWMAHIALTDIDAGKHIHHSRFARGAAGLAGQFDTPFRVNVGDWSISSLVGSPNFPWRIEAKAEDFALDVTVEPTKPLVLNGDAGLSHKGGAPGNASYYYSATRLQTSGTVSVGGHDRAVTGLSWLDREWSTSALAPGVVGWDWFSLQLSSGTDVMLYQLRETGGGVHAASSGTVTSTNGESIHLTPSDFTLEPIRWWRAPDDRSYPVAWTLRIPSLEVDAVVEARVDAQWMNTVIVYWEGSVAVRSVDGTPIGLGYLEMTGY